MRRIYALACRAMNFAGTTMSSAMKLMGYPCRQSSYILALRIGVIGPWTLLITHLLSLLSIKGVALTP